jgi:NitT/TauT family transport system substrate-binding protein
LIEFVLTQPPDRVSYRMLTPTDEDLKSIMHYAIKAGILKRPIDLGDIVDRRFIPEHIEPANIH